MTGSEHISHLLASLNASLADEKSFPLRYASPQGINWHTLASLDRSDAATIVASFARRKRLRVEVYLDYGDKEETKKHQIRLGTPAAERVWTAKS